MSDLEKRLKQAAMQIGAGGSAGFIEVCIMHPLDLVKTRLQIQATKSSLKKDPNYYSGILDCMGKMYRYEGLTSFWKGILPPILAETPKRATFSLAGLGAGITEAILVNPFEVVKVTLQSNRALATELPSTWSVTRQIVRENGLGFQGLNKGLTATIARNGVFNMVYFGFYHSVKGYFHEYEDPILEFGRKVAIGFTSGVLGSCVNIPFDVAKSRIQGPQPIPGVVKYSSTTSTIIMVYKEEGFRALYKGLLPKVLRLGPGGAIMLVVYDYVYHFLETKFQPKNEERGGEEGNVGVRWTDALHHSRAIQRGRVPCVVPYVRELEGFTAFTRASRKWDSARNLSGRIMQFGSVTRNWIRRPVKSGIPFNHIYISIAVFIRLSVCGFLRDSGVVAALAAPRHATQRVCSASVLLIDEYGIALLCTGEKVVFCRQMLQTNIDPGLLITLKESRPIIWDKTLENYKDTNLRTAAWREVCIVLREDFQEMEEKESQIYDEPRIFYFAANADNTNRILGKYSSPFHLTTGVGMVKKQDATVFIRQSSFAEPAFYWILQN
ncbi:Mitochondrial 2-oxodicarboxylate carrier [Eumeta japonica]|uniref:Mitochondrial 2-oxodicarboxylate carrier n=1 Tax=Eumeta variegata TaxID=151549 RepID=A0A4C1WQP0_EUMVA|nr:Mitochondrial 2-oxodicarboxylate carrier [Eumeta japonica]